jgi:hypothetical protein
VIIVELRGGEDTSNIFFISKMVVNLGGLGGAPPASEAVSVGF